VSEAAPVLQPEATIGILGGGQLGRMLALAAARLGFKCHVFAPSPDSPAFDVVHRVTSADYTDTEALDRFAGDVGDDRHAAVRRERRASGKQESREECRDMSGPAPVSEVEAWVHPSLLPIRLRRRSDAVVLLAPR